MSDEPAKVKPAKVKPAKPGVVFIPNDFVDPEVNKEIHRLFEAMKENPPVKLVPLPNGPYFGRSSK